MTSKIKVHEGQTVPIRTVVARLTTAARPRRGTQNQSRRRRRGPPRLRLPHPLPPRSAKAAAEEDSGSISPLVRRLARENNVDLSTVRGTQPWGRITKQDVLAAAAAVPQRPHPPRPGRQSLQRNRLAAVARSTRVAGDPPSSRRIYFGRYR